MKKNIIKRGLFNFFVLCSVITAVAQQSLTFKGQDRNGGYVQLHHIEIENITQGWMDTLFYPDTILFLSGVGVPNYGEEAVFSVSQNTPNPFNGATDFTMSLPYSDRVFVGVFDLSGRKITDLVQQCETGVHTFRVWLNSPQQYLLTVRTSRETASIKMLNTDNGGRNHIVYQAKGAELKTYRSGEHPFETGDLLRIIGFRQVDGQFQTSETIEITTIPDETVVLTFATLGEISGVRHFVDTNTVLIPDGMECDGDCFGTMNIHIYGYDPDAVLQSIEQLPYVRLKMEHECIGDLWIQVVCPNEQTATIMTKSWLGQSSQSNGCASLIPLWYWGWPGGNNEPSAHFGRYDIHNSNPRCDRL